MEVGMWREASQGRRGSAACGLARPLALLHDRLASWFSSSLMAADGVPSLAKSERIVHSARLIHSVNMPN